ncbi:hypothetical protein NS337_03575 [Pseudomonas oryzihabitans]|uniref:type II toxin-antitoxin system death-on-curing family toxin n=1 Tax=Pseudomonas oryzihabitans TaxID=47885 RepID=UPI000736EB8B|nr:type II toxin-antitoxin system death-on-curing family toxin [Pseudomonas psychrotolerans]KTT56424.1 hypothetical protein NS337_03575 [Pseudomonas psychrotolerans]
MPDYCEGIRFLSPEDLILINERLINMKTPGEMSGVFSMDALHRSQQSPNMYRNYESCEDILALAAVLLTSIARNHPFHNANKRTAAVAASIFLLINGYELTAPDSDFVEVTVGVVVGEIDREYVETFFYHWHRPLPDLHLEGTGALKRLIERTISQRL